MANQTENDRGNSKTSIFKQIQGYFEKYRGEIGIFLIIVIVLPIVICIFRYIYDTVSVDTYEVSWLGFFGSYLGGVLGGAATLIAVVYTIQKNKEEQIAREVNEKENIKKKSALIVFYDFHFAFENINSFMSMFWGKRLDWRVGENAQRFIENLISKDEDELDHNEMASFKACLDQLDQFYINSNWINTVANLYDSSQSDHEYSQADLEMIYKIYGNLMTIGKILKNTDFSTCKNAYKAMNEIIDFKTAHLDNFIVVFSKNYEVAKIMDKLYKTKE